jgi:uncharacterized protein YjbI with pentapeptide repeats
MSWNPFQNWTRKNLKVITPEDLLIRYDNGERDFSGIDLILSDEAFFCYSGIELKGIILKDIILRGAVLKEVDLSGIDLSSADLGGIFMEGCNLSKSTIRDANLHGACLTQCFLHDADLRGSNLNYINASFASFRGAKMNSFENAILTRANFQGATLDDSNSSGNICFRYSNNFLYQTTMPDGSIVNEGILC